MLEAFEAYKPGSVSLEQGWGILGTSRCLLDCNCQNTEASPLLYWLLLMRVAAQHHLGRGSILSTILDLEAILNHTGGAGNLRSLRCFRLQPLEALRSCPPISNCENCHAKQAEAQGSLCLSHRVYRSTEGLD